jgi:hypothetical protein
MLSSTKLETPINLPVILLQFVAKRIAEARAMKSKEVISWVCPFKLFFDFKFSNVKKKRIAKEIANGKKVKKGKVKYGKNSSIRL